MRRKSRTAGNSVQILHRLVGLETEYAIRFHPADRSQVPPSRFSLYEAFVASLKTNVLTAPVAHFKQGVFLANGGAVWFEAERPAAGGGLIEGSTPECRGPRAAVCYQRAQDRLFSQAAESAEISSGSLTLIKNDRDSRDHVYGAQENYDVVLATGWLLGCWRAGLVLLFPLLLLTWFGFLVMLSGLLVYLAIAALVFWPARFVCRDQQRLAALLFGRDLLEGRETGAPTPVWLETTLLWSTRVLTTPLAVALFLLAHGTAFRQIRRDLLPFLVSRGLLAGAGMVDATGRFRIADKAPAINSVMAFGGFFRDRPIFVLGHFFKAICAESSVSPKEYLDLFRHRQRLQIGLGDSNMSEMAEYLRVGTTALLLDVIEAGKLTRPPRLKHPIRSLRQFCDDPTLRASVVTAEGSAWSALELQRFYLDCCREFLDHHADGPEEAFEIVNYWEQALDALETMRDTGDAPEWLIGNIDWVTKKFLLEQAGSEDVWSVQKKIDIRYHELSSNGYYQMLMKAHADSSLVEPSEVERAMRMPPQDSPATMRSHFMREFGSAEEPLAVNWKQVVIGHGFGAKRIRLGKYLRDRSSEPDRPETPTRHA
jgi:hypothetical protein